MDFAFDPRDTKFDNVIRKMFSFRKDTTVVQQKGVSTVDDFFTFLAGSVPSPLTNILLGSHGNESAQMALQFVDGYPYTSYEALVFAITGIKRKCQLVDKIINPRPLDASQKPIPAFVYIRGCRIGKAMPFLTKMKEVINGLSTTSVGISAPKFFYELFDKTPQGIFEFFLYDFHAYMNKRFTTRADLIAELKQAKYNYQDIFGTTITDAQWDAWIPKKDKDIGKIVDPLLSVNLDPSPITNFPSLMGGRYKFEVVPDILTWQVDASVQASSIPKNKQDFPAFLKQQLNDRAAHPPPDDEFGLSLQASHPFPFYVRNGYTSIEEMVDGMEWVKGSDVRTFKSIRYEYTVSPPLIKKGVPNDPDRQNDLVFNFYPAPGSGVTASSMFTDIDPTYYQVV